MKPYHRWKPPERSGPVWKTREELLAVLAQYKKWYDEGLSDVEISFRIREKYGPDAKPHNPNAWSNQSWRKR